MDSLSLGECFGQYRSHMRNMTFIDVERILASSPRPERNFFPPRKPEQRTDSKDGPIYEPTFGGEPKYTGRYRKKGVVYVKVFCGPDRVDLNEYYM